jgi:hypothetical protein
MKNPEKAPITRRPTLRHANTLAPSRCVRVFVLTGLLACHITVLDAQTRTIGYSVDVRAHDNFPNAIHFYCVGGYNLAKCKAHVLILRHELTRYPIADLISWSFFLVPSDIWDEMVDAAGGPRGTPAFTALRSHETFFQDAIFSPTPWQRAEMMQMFRMDQNALFRLAVSHELAHALCRETNEQRAAAQGLDLQAGRAPRCK